MGFFTKLKKIFSGKEEESVSSEEEKKEAEVQEGEGRSSSQDEEAESSRAGKKRSPGSAVCGQGRGVFLRKK